VTASTNVGGSATVVVSSSLRRIVFTATGLPALPGNRVYQLWLMGPPETRSAGLLSQPSAGQTAPVLAGGLVSGDRVGVTVEPAGGTARPTTPPIVVIPLSE
jgi:anti-sigma-K factor RskA